MIKKSDVEEQKYILAEVIVGIVLLGIVIAIPVFFTKKIVYNLLGLLYGVAIAIGLSIHMWFSVNRALEIIPEDAGRYVVKSYYIRMGIAAILMLVVIYYNFGNYLFSLGGIFTLKVSAYIQPLTHKLIKCIAKGE